MTHIKVTTKNLEIDTYSFSFDYMIYWNGKFRTKGTYESDHVWQDDIPGFEKSLKKEGMVMLALEQLH